MQIITFTLATYPLQGKGVDVEKTTGAESSELFPPEFCTLKECSVSLAYALCLFIELHRFNELW